MIAGEDVCEDAEVLVDHKVCSYYLHVMYIKQFFYLIF